MSPEAPMSPDNTNSPTSALRSSALLGASERDWPEDFGSENGAYGHVCRDCGKSFVGHKRRPDQCRKCARLAKAEWDAMTPEQQAEKEQAMLAWLKAQTPNTQSSRGTAQP